MAELSDGEEGANQVRRSGYVVALMTGAGVALGTLIAGCNHVPREFSEADVDGGSTVIVREVSPQVVVPEARACDILFQNVSKAEVSYSDQVIGHWAQRGDQLAISFVSKADSPLAEPFTWRGAFENKTETCYDMGGRLLPGDVLSWP